MADVYSKGTRVWFPDKELCWISGEVTGVVKGANGALKLTFLDERGKVRSRRNPTARLTPIPEHSIPSSGNKYRHDRCRGCQRW
jgi:hypothetical protein